MQKASGMASLFLRIVTGANLCRLAMAHAIYPISKGNASASKLNGCFNIGLWALFN
jgi:hypothetical protein